MQVIYRWDTHVPVYTSFSSIPLDKSLLLWKAGHLNKWKFCEQNQLGKSIKYSFNSLCILIPIKYFSLPVHSKISFQPSQKFVHDKYIGGQSCFVFFFLKQGLAIYMYVVQLGWNS
jgi:hypothetical protein